MRKIVEAFKNNKMISTLWYKIYSHIIKSLKNKDVSINAQNHRDFQILQKQHEKYREKVDELKNKVKNNQKVKVAFLVVFDSVFPGERLFEQMLQDELFEPFIVTIPDISRGEENKFRQMDKTYKTLSEKYPNYVYKSWDDKKQEFIDFSEKMDMVCLANPYDSMTYELYRIEKLASKNILPIYFNYGYPAVNFAREVASLYSLSLVWKLFSESKYTLKEYSRVMLSKGKNLVLAGYMKMDNLAEQKKQQRIRKKIIIAPHHTIETRYKSLIGLSNFLQYADFFKELPKLYPQIDFIFRPHPLLKVTLEKEENWGKEKTDNYFKEIQKNKNLIYQEGGDYFETFVNSDGIIHDCSSFLAEYMFTKNPGCYMLAGKDSIEKYFMENGKAILKHYYQAFQKEDIINYIDTVILGGVDPKKEKRERFVTKELMVNYPNVSKFVIEYIKKKIK